MDANTLATKRLILRPWKGADAESLAVIKNVLNGAECYAICEKESGKPIGAAELKLNGHSDMAKRDGECELGYWLGKNRAEIVKNNYAKIAKITARKSRSKLLAINNNQQGATHHERVANSRRDSKYADSRA